MFVLQSLLFCSQSLVYKVCCTKFVGFPKFVVQSLSYKSFFTKRACFTKIVFVCKKCAYKVCCAFFFAKSDLTKFVVQRLLFFLHMCLSNVCPTKFLYKESLLYKDCFANVCLRSPLRFFSSKSLILQSLL